MSKQKKDFTQNILTGAEKFISEARKEKEAKRNPDFYRMNLKLDADLGDFIEAYHWEVKLSRNDVVAHIIRAYKEAWEAENKE